MTLLPKEEKSWGLSDVFQWLLILAIVCAVMQVYSMVFSRIKARGEKKIAQVVGSRKR